MQLNRLLVLGSDAAYYDYTVIALASFLKHNANWDALVMDVGMTPGQVRSLESVAQVVPYPRDEFKGGKSLYYASAMARCLALARFPSATRLMLYLDGDTVTLGSIEPLVEQFLASGRALGMAAEDDPGYYQSPVCSGWEGGVIPEEWVQRDRWANLPIINDGILLAFGPAAATIGHQCVGLYETFKARCRYEQQTILNAIVYENQIGWFSLSRKYHCYLKDQNLQKSGRPYIDPVYFNEEEIVIRHFCHEDNKAVLNVLKASLLYHYCRERGGGLVAGDQLEGPRQPSQSLAGGLAHAAKMLSVSKLDEVEDLCHLVLRIAPNTAEAHRFLGLVAYLRHRFAEATDHVQRALALAPWDAAARDNLSCYLMALGRPVEAESAARRALALNPQLANAAHNLGVALKRQGRFPETELPLRPNNPNVWNDLGTTPETARALRGSHCLPGTSPTDASRVSLGQSQLAADPLSIAGPCSVTAKNPMKWNRIVVLGSDAAYYDYTVIAIASFLKHNPNWDILVMDVGMTPAQVRSLESVAQVVPYPREEFKETTGFYIPSAKARCLALATFPSATRLMLYLDGDTVTLGSIDALVEQFLASGQPIGIAAENDPRFYRDPVSASWEGGVIPEEWVHRERWAQMPILNTGVLLAIGSAAAEVGHQCVNLYENFKTRFRYGEQTIINAVLYENQVGLFPLALKYHCYVNDLYLRKSGRPYIDPVYLNEEEIVIRHFCHKDTKAVLNVFKAILLNHYCLGMGRCLPAANQLEGLGNPSHSLAGGLVHGGKMITQGKLDEVDNLCHSVLQIAPDTAEAYRLLGLAAYGRGQFDKAKDHVQRALTLAPWDAAAHDNLSLVLMALGRPVEAEAAARQALALNPQLAHAAHNLGLALKRQGRFAEAEFPLRQSLALEPDNPSVWNNLGTNLAKLERFHEAIDCLERALQLVPEFSLAKANLQQIRSVALVNDLPGNTITDVKMTSNVVN